MGTGRRSIASRAIIESSEDAKASADVHSENLSRRITAYLNRGQPEGAPRKQAVFQSIRAVSLPDALNRAIRAFEQATGTKINIFCNLTPHIALPCLFMLARFCKCAPICAPYENVQPRKPGLVAGAVPGVLTAHAESRALRRQRVGVAPSADLTRTITSTSVSKPSLAVYCYRFPHI